MVMFWLDDQRYAVHLGAVERVVRAAETVQLPKAPRVVLGVINVQGSVIPVVDLRIRFGRPARGLKVSDHFLLAQTVRRSVALWVDQVAAVIGVPEDQLIAAETVLPHLPYVKGLLKLEDGLILIHDLDTFLSLEEEETLDQALPEAVTHG